MTMLFQCQIIIIIYFYYNYVLLLFLCILIPLYFICISFYICIPIELNKYFIKLTIKYLIIPVFISTKIFGKFLRAGALKNFKGGLRSKSAHAYGPNLLSAYKIMSNGKLLQM